MFRKKNYLALIIFLIAIKSQGQTANLKSLHSEDDKNLLPKNIIYAQLLGDVFLVGINYERVYTNNKFVNLSARVGFGVIGNGYDIILGNNILFGKKMFYIEVGINPLLTISHAGKYFMVTGNIGMRYHSKNDGFFMKLAYNPILYNKSDGNILPISIGIGGDF